MKTIFISYTKVDLQWAQWIGWQLEEEGVRVIMQAWDFRPGANFALEMHKAAKETDRIIAVLSPDFMDSAFTQPEWAAGFAQDPEGTKRKLLPVRVRKCKPDGLLAQVVYIDLVGLREQEAREVLIEGVMKERGKPDTEPVFPAGLPAPVEHERTISQKPGFPSIKISLTKLPVTGAKLFGREDVLKRLDEAWNNKNTHMVTLIAFGGVGKTALVNVWLNQMEQENFRGAKRVYGWSFYSQGAAEGSQAAADLFLVETLEWFGDPEPGNGNAYEKGKRLAELIRKERTLLILDGLEPLQYPPGDPSGMGGQIKDQGVQVLVKELATSQPGLCVISSRETVTDVKVKEGFSLERVDLERLSNDAGVALLKSLGVSTGSGKDMTEAVTEYGGHALALTLLGNFV
ncbi:MAG: toll/interleukin-1 receptor domain-containing protein, partial [bacterium]|nr:toll/interleukin-1 receptor domain-containing protein [bacterium]